MERETIIKLADKMRDDWNSRIAFDYQSWMNDRVQSDEELWQTGERDFNQLILNIPSEALVNATALDLGCGVGRLLRPASKVFRHVIGTDISSEAIAQATTLLSDLSNVSLQTGNGTDLAKIESASVDFVYSFGVLSNMPISVCAIYLYEVARVLRMGAYASLQIFTGKCQPTVQEDTIAFRSFGQENLAKAFDGFGLRLISANPLTLAEEVPDDGWLRPFVFTLEKIKAPEIDISQATNILAPDGEDRAPVNWEGSHTEYLLAVMRAEELVKSGKNEEATKALKFAVSRYGNSDPKLIEFIKKNS